MAQDTLESAFRITAFGDFAVAGDSAEKRSYSARLDAFLTARDIWQGASLNFHFEYVDGDDIFGLGGGGVIWPTNIYAAVPRLTGDNNATLSFTLTQEISPSAKVSFGKFNVVEMALGTPLAGGNGRGGFQYTGIAAPPSFVFPPYVFGGSLSIASERWSYSLMVYDPNNAQGSDFWGNLFGDGVVFNGTATYKTSISGLPGFYSINLIHSTAEGTDYNSLATVDGIGTFTRTTEGISFAALKFQQYLSHDASGNGDGWGIFGQIGFGDGNPNQLDTAFVLGLAGSSPIQGRNEDRWGLAWSRYNWSDALVSALKKEGGAGLRDEWAVEAFYEAELWEGIRFGANVMRIHPGLQGSDEYTQVGLRLRATF